MPKTTKKHTFRPFSNQHEQGISPAGGAAVNLWDDEQTVSSEKGSPGVSPDPTSWRDGSSSNSVPWLSELMEGPKAEAAGCERDHVMPKTAKHARSPFNNHHGQTICSGNEPHLILQNCDHQMSTHLNHATLRGETPVVSYNTKGWRVDSLPSPVPLFAIMEDQAGEEASSKCHRALPKVKKNATYRPFNNRHEQHMPADKETALAPILLPERKAPVVRKETNAWRVDYASSSISPLPETMEDQMVAGGTSLDIDKVITEQEAIAEHALISPARVDIAICAGPTPRLQDVMERERVDRARRLERERHMAEMRQQRDQLASQSLSENMKCLREVSDGYRMTQLCTLLRVAAAKASREDLEEAASKACVPLSHPMMSQMFFVQQVASFSFEQTKKEDIAALWSVPRMSSLAMEQLDQRGHRRFEIFRSFMRRAVILKHVQLKLPLLRYHNITLRQLVEPWTYDIMGSIVRPLLWTRLTPLSCMLISKFVSLPALVPPLAKACAECITHVSCTITSKVAVLEQKVISVEKRIQALAWKLPKNWVTLTHWQQDIADEIEELRKQSAHMSSEMSLLRSF